MTRSRTMDLPPLPLRSLGRVDRLVPPLIWQIDGPVAPPAEVLRACRQAADWWFIPASLGLDAIGVWMNAMSRAGDAPATVVLGVDVADTLGRGTDAIERRLAVAASGGARTDAVMLQGAGPSALKAGRPFHRLAQLRDRGRINLIFLEADDVAAAAWMVEHTPAHAVCVPYGLADLSAQFAVLPAARELGTAVVAIEPRQPAWTTGASAARYTDLSYVLGQPDVTAAMEPVPPRVDDLRAVLATARDPMSSDQRARWWAQFQHAVGPPPAAARGAHPPDLEG